MSMDWLMPLRFFICCALFPFGMDPDCWIWYIRELLYGFDTPWKSIAFAATRFI